MTTRILYLILILFLLVIGNSLKAQPVKSVDSLKNELALAKEDTLKVSIYNELFHAYLNINNDTALKYVNLGLSLAKKLEYTEGIGELLTSKGDYMVVRNDLFTARDSYIQAIDYFRVVNKFYSLSNVYLALGNIYVVQGNYSGALNYYLISLNIADSLNYTENMSHLYNNLGIIYFKLEDLAKSLEYYEKAVELQSEVGNLKGKAAAHTNISNIHIGQKNFEDARFHINSAIEIAESLPDNDVLAECYIKLGSLEYRQGNFEAALNFYLQALELIQNLGQDFLGPLAIKYANIYIYLGSCYLKIGNNNLAEDNFIKAYDIADETGQLELLTVVSHRLYDLFKLTNQYKKALYYFEEYKMFSDSIESTENVRRIAQLEMQFEFDKKLKERELEQTKKDATQKRKELIYLMATSGILLGLIIFVLLFLLQKNKVKRIELHEKNLELELESKNKELTTNVLYLLKKNEFILNMVEKLKKAKLSFKPETNVFLDKFIRELEAGTSKDTWQEFETRFQDVHTGFYKELNTQFPDLTPNELKLCAFLRLNMSSKEISTITFQSFSTLTTARYRLRKKLGIERDENLISFLNQL